MNIFGLDLGSTSIKIAQISREGTAFKLTSAGISQTPIPGLKSDAEADLVQVATVVKKLHQEAKISTKNGVIALPEELIFTRVIELPAMNDNELAQAVPWEAEQFVPMPLSEVTLDWQIVSKPMAGKEGEKIKVFLAVAPTKVIQKYVKVLETAGLLVVAIETEIIASARSLVPSSPTPVLLIDLGAKSTNMAVVQNGSVVLTRAIQTGGEAFTRAVSTNLSLGLPQAEEYKIAYGLAEKELEGKIKKAIIPVFDLVIAEIKKIILLWKEKENQLIGSVIVSGGTASLPELGTVLTKELGIEVQVADPFCRLTGSPATLKLREKAPLFAVAIGLAEKEL